MKAASHLLIILALLAGFGTGWSIHSALKRDAKSPAPAGLDASSNAIEPTRVDGADPAKGFFDRLHEVLGIPSRAKRERMIATIAEDLDVAQLRAAIERVAQSRISNRSQVLAQLFARWGELEPLAAIEFAKSLPRSSERADVMEAILSGWVETDSAAAEKWASQLPSGTLKTAAWTVIIEACATNDPMRALALAQHLDSSSWKEVGHVSSRIFGPWAVRDPAGAARQADQLPQGPLRMDAQCVIAMQWAETDPESALEWAQSLRDLLPNESDGFGGRLTSIGAERSNAAKRIIETWLKRDADAAVSWLGQLPDDPWKNLLLTDACSQNTETTRDPRVALQLANLFPEGGQRDEALQYTAERLGQVHSESALALLSLEMDTRAKRSIMSGLAEALKGEDLLAALRLSAMSGFALEGVTRWGDPQTAASWAVQQPNNEKYLPQIAGEWMTQNPEQAEKLVRSLPPPMKDSALSRAVNGSLNGRIGPSSEMTEKYGRLAGWASEIADPNLRQNAYRNLARTWLRIEPESGQRWLNSAPISAEQRAELLKLLSTRK